MIDNYEDYLSNIKQRLNKFSSIFSLNTNNIDLDKLVTKNRITQSQADFIKRLKISLEDLMPNRYDIQFTIKPNFNYFTNQYGYNKNLQHEVFSNLELTYVNIVLYYPEITIKNGKRQSLLLKDIYVNIPIQIKDTVSNQEGTQYIYHAKDKPEFKRIQGTRTTVSIPEYLSSYCHSHLQSRNYQSNIIVDFTNFCTGSGDINAVQALLNAEFDKDTFELFIHNIEPFLSWESLEGRPHIYMANTITKDFVYPDVDESRFKNVFNKIKHLISKKRLTIDVDWKFINGNYEIVDNEKFETFLTLLKDVQVSRYDGNDPQEWWLYKDELGNYFKESEIDESVTQVTDKWIPFRGEKKYFKVEGTVYKSGPDKTLYLHPKIKNYVKSRLEYHANNAKIRESGVKKLNTTNNT